MTIQKQYVLPNCSLILEGLSADASNVLSILANAEFKLVGLEAPLAGGSDFFKAMASAVSAYCQRLLSGVDHPDHMDETLVAVAPDEGQYHQLRVKPELIENSSGPQTFRLSTVQLFDMAEAIDQFCADTQTLPDFSLSLAPLPRKYVRSDEPLVQRAMPPLLGLGTVAIAALGLFLLPVPELREPENPLEQPSADLLDAPETPLENETDAADTPAEAASAPNETDTPVQNTAITDSTQIAALQQQVEQTLTDGLDATFDQPLRYQVSVAENGDIVGYSHSDDASLDADDSTPLPDLPYIPVDNGAVGAIAQFDVTFTPDGAVEVVSEQVVVPEPDAADSEETAPDAQPEDTSESDSQPTSDSQASLPETDSDVSIGTLTAQIDTPIQDADRIYELNQELRRTITRNRADDWSGPTVRYRVRLDEQGNVTGYEADDAAAQRYAAASQIPSLVKTVSADNPQLDFLVVINDENVVEVNPWDGWP
ncbi:MAG: DUF4335 domain-containing protein [Leptolyngbyaceae cyanobacterium]